MSCPLKILAGEEFDALIIGGGIYGATLAWTLARRGVKTALAEAGDFGGGASANSLKILHGGLRYLQHAHFKRMRQSIRARHRLMQLAPALTRPLGCLMPTRGFGIKSRLVMRAALAINDSVSRDRNAGLKPEQRLPPGRLLNRAAFHAAVPNYLPTDHTGAALWFDAIADNTDRLTLAFVLSAQANGAVVANYTKAVRLGAGHAELENTLTGEESLVRGRVIVCAAGPGNEKLHPRARGPWVKSANLILKRPLLSDHALAMESPRDYVDSAALIKRGRRNFFAVPWRGGTMIGTSYAPCDAAAAPVFSAEELNHLVEDVNATRAFAPISTADVSRLHVGLLPSTHPGSEEPAKDVLLAELEPDQFFLQGIKYTTAIETADEVADILQRRLEMDRVKPADEPLIGTTPAANVEYAVKNEWAVRLSDYIFRRTTLGDFGPPAPGNLAPIAAEMARLLNWSDARREDEIAEVIRSYSIPRT